MSQTKAPARIDDVARAAHVSITTVSHVLSGKRPVAAKTREAVLAAAASLNYVPLRSARGLATGRTMSLGLQFPMDGEQLLLNPYFPRLLEGLSGAAVAAGFSFVLLPNSTISGFPLDAVLATQRIDAAILIDPFRTSDVVSTLREHDIPVVSLGGRYPGRTTLHCVDNDSDAAIERAVDYGFDQGYSRPALVSLKTLRGSYVVDIEAGFRRAVTSRGIAPLIVRAREVSEQAGSDAVVALMRRRHPPDLVLAAADRLAVGVAAVLVDLGLRVPDEIGVIGEGNTLLAQSARPPLTSIDPHPDRLGRAAIDLIRDVLADGNDAKPRNIVVPASLVKRMSTRS